MSEIVMLWYMFVYWCVIVYFIWLFDIWYVVFVVLDNSLGIFIEGSYCFVFVLII